jgi:hypothetical protein
MSREARTPTLDTPPDRRPPHIAIIMDGNGRWAKRQNLPRIEGHRRGVDSVRRTTEECARLGIGQLTLYCLSSENWKRPQTEINFLMHLLEQYMIEERGTIMDNNVRVRMLGRRDNIPDQVLQEMDKTVEMSARVRRDRAARSHPRLRGPRTTVRRIELATSMRHFFSAPIANKSQLTISESPPIGTTAPSQRTPGPPSASTYKRPQKIATPNSIAQADQLHQTDSRLCRAKPTSTSPRA